MCAGKRLRPEERKRLITEAAADLFCKKGFRNTTMEDIATASNLSKGGLYHYYGNTTEILKDLMVMGIKYRNRVIASYEEDLQKGCEASFIAERIVEKIVDENPLMEIYVEFLLVKEEDPELDRLFTALKEQTRVELLAMEDFFTEDMLKGERFDLLTDVINSMIIGANTLGARENFVRHKTHLVQMIEQILEK